MKLRFLFLIISIAAVTGYSQTKPVKKYTDMVINGNNLWAINADSNVVAIDVNTNVIKKTIHTDDGVTALAVNHNGQLIVADEKQQIKLWNDKDSAFQTIGVSAVPVYQVVCDNKNGIFLVTAKGITNLKDEKYYLPDSAAHLNSQRRRGWPVAPVVFIDRQNNIWVGGAYGEWGGDLFIFNTDQKKFIVPALNIFRMELNPIKSFFTDGRSVYVSSGLEHFMSSGEIVRFTNYECYPVFESHVTYKDTVMMFKLAGSNEGPKLTPMKTMVDGEYIGPSAFNPSDRCIYFYCQYGIYKGDPAADLSVITNWKKIAAPRLHWKSGQPDAVGSPMNVLKMDFAPNGKLYLLTQNDGIGVYNGSSFRLLQ